MTVKWVSTAAWNEATDRAIKGEGVADDPRCLYGWGCDQHMFGHMCDRPFRHPGKCMQNTNGDRFPCESVRKPKDWDDTMRTECNS